MDHGHGPSGRDTHDLTDPDLQPARSRPSRSRQTREVRSTSNSKGGTTWFLASSRLWEATLSTREPLWEQVAKARNAASVNLEGGGKSFAPEYTLAGALAELVLVAERYPEIKADQGFTRLQIQLTEIEDLIARSRQYYNDAVLRLHDLALQLPGSLIVPLTRGDLPEYFHAEDPARFAPTVQSREPD